MGRRKANKPVTKEISPIVVFEADFFGGFFCHDIGNRALNHQLTDDEKAKIAETYRKVYRMEMKRGCNNCFSDAFFELYNLYTRDKTGFYDRFNCEYALKAGAVMTMIDNMDLTVTNHNLTNSLAEAHLRQNRAKVRYFQRLPDDWEQRIALI